jgi:S-methylmethionine-dependent homocysteine/selenocysteine methylase
VNFTLLDGGMGKLLLANGAPFRQPEWSALALMEGHDYVVDAHRQFIDAGADVIITNNYAVAPYHLGEERFAEQAAELAAVAGELARRAADGADREVKVAGSLPPMFGSYTPETFDPEAAPELLATIADALAPHVDLFLPETQSVLDEVRASAAAARRHDKPLWVSVTLSDLEDDGPSMLRSGESVTAAADVASEIGAEALLFNCSRPEKMEPAVIEARAALPRHVEVGVYANAFEQRFEQGYAANGVILDHRAELNDGGYSAFAARWVDAGATIIGGCCGIMPHHIADIASLR